VQLDKSKQLAIKAVDDAHKQYHKSGQSELQCRSALTQPIQRPFFIVHSASAVEELREAQKQFDDKVAQMLEVSLRAVSCPVTARAPDLYAVLYCDANDRVYSGVYAAGSFISLRFVGIRAVGEKASQGFAGAGQAVS